MASPHASTSASPLPASTSDPFRPSFFELIAQDQLRDMLHPAVRYTLSVFAQRHPRYLLRLFNSFDEVWALVMLAVERHYLKTWGSSFTENFYMLRRRRRPGLTSSRLPPSKRSEKLTAWQINASLFCLVGLPYLQAKAHDWWERNGGGVDEDLFDDDDDDDGEAEGFSRHVDAGEQGADGFAESTGAASPAWTGNFEPPTFRAKLRAAAAKLKASSLKAYPYAASFWQVWILSYNVRYLFAKTHFWRPWLSWLNLEIRRVGPGDYPASIPLLPPDLPSPLTRPREFLMRLVRAGPYMAFESLKYLLPASIFFFKFLEWWHSGDNPRRRTGNGGDGGAVLPRFGAPRALLPNKRGVVYRKLAAYKDPSLAVDYSDAGQEEETRASRRDSGVMVHNSCPVCGATPINNPAVLPTGYAMCYPCANSYVEDHGKCPVTQMVLRDGVEGIRRVLA
ncbi:unnamed protein product [Parajaminaea phylloscopi]